MERRECCEVILQILDKIPPNKTAFIKDLKWNYDDASYKAPEDVIQWHRTQDTLVKHIPEPSQDWEFQVLSIFTTKSIDEIKEMLRE